MLAKISSRQLSEWMAFERLEPFEGWRGDYRNALLISQVVNTIVGIFNGNKRSKFSDYMPDFVSAFLDEDKKESDDRSKIAGNVAKSLTSKGSIKVWQGKAPPIKRIGKRGKPTSRKKRLQEILYGKPRHPSIPDRG